MRHPAQRKRGVGAGRRAHVKVGILGGGQLGRMLALEGFRLGLTFRFLDPHADAPAAGLGELVQAPYDDLTALESFARDIDFATYEFENVPGGTARALAARVPVYPPPGALRVAQDRLLEKETFDSLAIPTAPYASAGSLAGLADAADHLGFPLVLKTRRWGYDGKGQVVVRASTQLSGAWEALGAQPLLAEGFVPFSRELSILGVRGSDGEVAFYPLAENEHRAGILHRTLAPAPRSADGLQQRAEEYLARLLESLQYVGVLALELFELEGSLLANEMAPRVHNSGHWTLDGAVCSQFENHLRAVCGYPLGSTKALGHAAMLNLVGTLPRPDRVLSIPEARLHLYGKAPRPGRKLGHVTVVAATELRARELLVRVGAATARDSVVEPGGAKPPSPAPK